MSHPNQTSDPASSNVEAHSTTHAKPDTLDNSSNHAPLHANRDQAELSAALAAVNSENPGPSALQRLDRALRRFPDAYKAYGNLALHSQTKIADSLTSDPTGRSAFRLVASDLRRELSLPTDTALERLIVEQCISAYMLHYALEIRYTKFGFTSETTIWDARLQASQTRFLRAVEALARLRQLALPVMQINIAETQTNIAAPSSSAPNAIDQ